MGYMDATMPGAIDAEMVHLGMVMDITYVVPTSDLRVSRMITMRSVRE